MLIFPRSWTVAVLAIVAGWVCCPSSRAADEAAVAWFQDHVAPVLERRCLTCHNESDRKGGLSLESGKSLAAGGESGEVVVPGDLESSYLLELIAPHNGKAEMPKNADPLSAEEVGAIERWIESGAVWPPSLRLQEARVADTDWWSLKPIQRPEMPRLSAADAAWVETPVDAFVLEKLRQQGLEPSPAADRRTLIRRLYFDLIGLPPTPEEVASFASDDDPRAYARLVDRLLDSPHYGQRWARHWLDVAHYGDTHGYDKDKPRPNAWPYRDYVIRSFNDDKPYGRFIREQIAGDVLDPDDPDGVVATGFIAAGPWDFISHVEVPEAKIDGQIARSLDRDDMVRVTIETFNSVTIGCARCHHHKFDPVGQDDYYALQAVFAAVDRADRPYDPDPAVHAQRRRLLARQRDLTRQREQFDRDLKRLAGDELKQIERQLATLESEGSDRERPEFGWHSRIEATRDVAKWVQVDLGRSISIDRIVYVGCHDTFNNIGAGFGFPVRYRIELSDDPTFAGDTELVVDHTGADIPNPGVVPQTADAGGKTARYVRMTATRLAPRKNDFIFALAELQVIGADGKNAAAGAEVTSLDSIEAPVRWSRENLVDGYYYGMAADPSVRERIHELGRQREELLARVLTPRRQERLAALERELEEVQAGLERLPPPSLVYAAASHFPAQGNFRPTGGQPREIRVLKRGDVVSPGDVAEPGALQAVEPLTGRFALPADHKEGDRRAALANWLADERHPLTWRSIVNRVWLYHFGRGIVDSPNDFGRMGQLPTHPELLDWLAVEFRDGGQSIKSLHRLICNSATYRQASAHRESAAAVDADNQWLWRMNRRRLDAESIRDAVLKVSGALDDTRDGPGFQDFVIEKPEHSPHYQYHLHDPDDRRSHRRSIYRFIVRSQQQPFMTTLDCADPSMQVEKRNETVTPLQALALLNNKFMVAMAQRFAARVAESGEDEPAQLAAAFELALGRQATEAELARLVEYAGEHGLANACRVILNLNEFVFVD